MAMLTSAHRVQIDEPPIARALFSETWLSPLWLIIRVYAGYQWLVAGYDKVISPAWTGDQAGTSIVGFAQGALKLTTGAHPSVPVWYAWFLSTMVLPYSVTWSWLITLGEIAVGIGLILGLFTGVAAFFGGLMNANYLLAGTVSINPLLFILATWIVLGWRVAGYLGLDYFVLPMVGVPGHPGKLFEPNRAKTQPVIAGAAR
jgi:thiosulfate dehydrogenase (quinone) large subunit